jgi:hypothetical protein
MVPREDWGATTMRAVLFWDNFRKENSDNLSVRATARLIAEMVDHQDPH